MSLKIRLRQQGRTNDITYRLVVTDSRYRRDGNYVEMLGWYNPQFEGSKDSHIEEDRIQYWIDQGAQMTEKAKALIARRAPRVIKVVNERRREKLLKRAAQRRKKESPSVKAG